MKIKPLTGLQRGICKTNGIFLTGWTDGNGRKRGLVWNWDYDNNKAVLMDSKMDAAEGMRILSSRLRKN